MNTHPDLLIPLFPWAPSHPVTFRLIPIEDQTVRLDVIWHNDDGERLDERYDDLHVVEALDIIEAVARGAQPID